MPGPLHGIRVVELGVWVAGPAAGGILADWGAEVTKVEAPGGDPGRSFQQMLGGDMPTNPPFELDNRSKHSIVIDVTRPEGRALVDELLSEADVFVTNLRLGALERLGLDYETVHAAHPKLVYGHITGYGREGDDADRPAYDVAAFWARSGIASLLTPEGENPPFQRGGMGDHSTGLACAAAVCAALHARHETGEGQLVSTSLLRQGVYTLGFDLNITLLWGLTLRVGRREEMFNPAMNNYVSGDGRRFWIVGLEAERHWPPLARAVGRPEWIDDERFSTAMARAQNGRELTALLDEIFVTRTFDEWAAAFDAEPDLFWSPVNTVDDLLADPQFHAAGSLVDVPDGASTTTMVATPADFSATPWEPRSTAPGLGEHTDEVLARLGRSPEQIAALRSDGVVGGGPPE